MASCRAPALPIGVEISRSSLAEMGSRMARFFYFGEKVRHVEFYMNLLMSKSQQLIFLNVKHLGEEKSVAPVGHTQHTPQLWTSG